MQPNGNDPKVILVLALAIYYILQNLVPHAGTKITYSELVGDLGPMPPPNEELHYRDSRLDEAIGELVAACRARGLPAISALVIREVERNPGAGYYSTAHPAEWAKDRMLAEVAWAKERELARQTSYPARLSALTPNTAFAFDVDDRASRRDRLVADGPVARAVEVDAAVRPHLRQEVPAVAADGFEVLLAGIPRIEADVAGREAALLGGGPHFPEVVVLGLPGSLGRVDKAVVGRIGRVAIAPDERDQVDAADKAVMLARTAAADEGHLTDVGFVQDGDVDDKDAVRASDVGPDLNTGSASRITSSGDGG